MTTQQDILRTMMTQLDEASDKIPEGLYLQFCDHLKNLHPGEDDEHSPRHTSDPNDPEFDWFNSPEVVESRRFYVRQEQEFGGHARAELCRRQVMLLRFILEKPIWYLGLAIFYLIRFVYFRFKDIYSVIKTHRDSRTNYKHNETFKMIQQTGPSSSPANGYWFR